MQGKGIIRAFAILLAVVCILQYFFWWKTSAVENRAEDYATEVASNYEGEEQNKEFRRARIAYLDSISSETVLTIPLVKDYTYNELKSSTLNLGLDLKGGMSAVLEVNVRELIEQSVRTYVEFIQRFKKDKYPPPSEKCCYTVCEK